MAGAYPDVPSWRMAWDRDGVQGYRISGGVPAQMTADQLTQLNDESGNNVISNGTFCFIFPELRDLDACWVNASSAISSPQVSTDTTNGVDGTWATAAIGSSNDAASPLGATWRNEISSTTALGVIAFRFTTGGWLRNVHMFGEPSPGQNLKRLEIWHPTLNQRAGAAYFDWGNVPRGGSADVSFRVKNMHDSKTAMNISLTFQALTDTDPSVPAQHVLSTDGGSLWTASRSLGDLAPGAVSPVVLMRRITPSNAVLTTPRWAHRILAVPSSWS